MHTQEETSHLLCMRRNTNRLHNQLKNTEDLWRGLFFPLLLLHNCKAKKGSVNQGIGVMLAGSSLPGSVVQPRAPSGPTSQLQQVVEGLKYQHDLSMHYNECNGNTPLTQPKQHRCGLRHYSS